MKRLVPVFVFCLLWCVSCEQNDPKRGGDSSLNQPSDPATWSPKGHVYVYETTWENSPAADHYWVWVLDFISKDSCVWYETELRDLTYNGSPAYERTSYKVNYPKLTLNMDGGRVLNFTDTTTIDASIWDVVYTILK